MSSSAAIIRVVGKYGHEGRRRIWVNDNGCATAAAAATVRRLLLLSAAASASTPGLFACCNGGGRAHTSVADRSTVAVERAQHVLVAVFGGARAVYCGSHPAPTRLPSPSPRPPPHGVMILHFRLALAAVGVMCPPSRSPLRADIVRWRVTRYRYAPDWIGKLRFKISRTRRTATPLVFYF